ncbi:MAG: transglutaminase domain-containing protein, partial [Planctomycetota bacterium]
VLSHVDAIAIVSVIGLRFSSHRNLQWSHPRFLSDWAGINGMDMPSVFGVIGLVVLLVALLICFRFTDWKHGLKSVASLVIVLLLLAWLGNGFALTRLVSRPPSGSGDSAAGSDSSGGASDSNGSGESSEPSVGSSAGGDNQAGASGSDDQRNGKSNQSKTAAKSNASSSSAGKNDPFPRAADQSKQPRPIAMVLLEDDIEPYEKAWYFRQNAASQFTGRRLAVAVDETLDTDIIANFPSEKAFIGGVPLPEDMHQIVPIVVNLITEQPRPFALPTMIEVEPTTNPNPDYFRQSYRASSCVLTNYVFEDEVYDLYGTLTDFESGNPEWDDEMLDHYKQFPDDPRYKELAEQILSEKMGDGLVDDLHETPMMKALSIKRWLEENTTYSHDPRFDDPSANPAEDFLFGRRFGYCTHVAHASVYLMRSLGLPSRIGIGYAVDQKRSGKSSAILIMDSDAHAWPELYLENVGWVVVDASPEKIDPSTQLPQEPDKAASDFLADKARGKSEHKGELERAADPNPGVGFSWRDLLVMLVIALIGSYLFKWWIMLAPRFCPPDELAAATHRATVLQLAEVGLQRDYGETHLEFASRLASHFPEFKTISDRHAKQTYGGGTVVDRNECLELQRAVVRNRSDVTSLIRRIVGAIDPRFWVLIR